MPRPSDKELLSRANIAIEQHLTRLEKRLESVKYNIGEESPIELTEELMRYSHESFAHLQLQFMKLIAEATRND